MRKTSPGCEKAVSENSIVPKTSYIEEHGFISGFLMYSKDLARIAERLSPKLVAQIPELVRTQGGYADPTFDLGVDDDFVSDSSRSEFISELRAPNHVKRNNLEISWTRGYLNHLHYQANGKRRFRLPYRKSPSSFTKL